MQLRSKFGEAEREEIMNYNEVQDYLANGTYPEEATKVVKGVIRKRAKKFQLVYGVLHYKETLKTGQLRLIPGNILFNNTFVQCVHNM